MEYIAIFLLLALSLWFLGNYNIWRKTKPSTMPRILMYHSVSDDIEPSGMNITLKKFEKQIRYLRKKNYKFITISEIINHNKKDKNIIAITFDDGFANNYEASQILRKYNACGTIYLSPQAIDVEQLSAQQITNMADVIEFGAHTINHINLQNADDKTALEEIKNSQQYVKDIVGKCNSFAYPYGRHFTKHVDMVRELGFSTAVTTKKTIQYVSENNILTLPRISVNGKANMWQFKIALAKGRYKL